MSARTVRRDAQPFVWLFLMSIAFVHYSRVMWRDSFAATPSDLDASPLSLIGIVTDLWWLIDATDALST